MVAQRALFPWCEMTGEKVWMLPWAIIFATGYGCGDPLCAEGKETWIDEAPQAMAEFREVVDEVSADTGFVGRFSVRSFLFLRQLDTADYRAFNVPKAMAWFRAGRGYIALDPGDTSFCYRDCEVGGFTAYAYVYDGPRRYGYKDIVQVIDSVDLGDGWYAHVTTCRGCDE
jgi:hypothetical protein